MNTESQICEKLSILKPDFDLMVQAKIAGFGSDDEPFFLNSDGKKQPVEIVGFDLHSARFGNDSENAEFILKRVRQKIEQSGITPKQAISDLFPDQWKPGDLAETSSGMGGVFTVKLTHRSPNGGWKCKVHMPRNPDWHGFAWYSTDEGLKPIN